MSDHNNDQVRSLVDALNNVMVGLMKVGGSGTFGMVREGMAAVSFLREARESFSGNQLIQQVIETVMNRVQGGSSEESVAYDQPEDAMLAQIGAAVAGLQGEDGLQFRQMLLQFAEKVASAAGQGLFGSGEKISSGEANFLAKLQQVLGL
ncbi:MAG: hypothetical protein NZ750_10930 [Anaerolineae bacterium]|nr:hypothetical protein [Anaerolineae bacterium]MDW8171577.1 hypothetical protein [Anaerolineae bacterium]